MTTPVEALTVWVDRAADKAVRRRLAASRSRYTRLRTEVRLLRTRIQLLEKQMRRLPADTSVPPPAPPSGSRQGWRIRGKTVRAIRRRLRLSQRAFAQLVHVAVQTVLHWESQGDRLLRLRPQNAGRIAALRTTGRRQIAKKLGLPLRLPSRRRARATRRHT